MKILAPKVKGVTIDPNTVFTVAKISKTGKTHAITKTRKTYCNREAHTVYHAKSFDSVRIKEVNCRSCHDPLIAIHHLVNSSKVTTNGVLHAVTKDKRLFCQAIDSDYRVSGLLPLVDRKDITCKRCLKSMGA